MIKLPPISPTYANHAGIWVAVDDVRARDLEVARIVLEAVAKEMEKVFGGHLIYGYPVGETIRALKAAL